MPQVPTVTSNPSQPGQKRKRGGQPGNTNALKNGLYLAGYRLRDSAQVNVHIPNINDLIDILRSSIQVTFEVGLNAHNLEDSIEALNSISMATNGLIRLINLSCKSNNSKFGSGLDQLSLEASQALIAKYRRIHAEAANLKISTHTQ